MQPAILQIEQAICSDATESSKLEWLETNGLGGFACSTVSGINTRRYHGLLTAALRPPVDRYLLLSKVEETLVIGERRFDLSANRYPGAVHPTGYQYLKQFRLDPYPIFTFQAEGIEIEKRVFLVHGENTVVLEYDFRGIDWDPPPYCSLEVRPLIAFRDYHSLTHANSAIDRSVRIEPGVASVEPYAGLPRLYFAHNAYAVQPDGHWYYKFEYAVEKERGLDAEEDLFCPLVVRFDLNGQPNATLVASTIQRTSDDAPVLRAAEQTRREKVRRTSPCPEDPLVSALTVAADQFVVKRTRKKSVIAGYPWFADWGRDTMISLPGLTLVTGRYDAARCILLSFADSIDHGMLPNRFPDSGETPEYNTVDATLWFFEAIRAYVAYTGDYEFVRNRLYTKLENIIDWHVRGTRYGIRMDEDALLQAGETGVQLTWMDAKVGDWVITPRHGKPVEIQALWYNALRTIQEFATQFEYGGASGYFADLAARAKQSFLEQFWNEPAGCLFDVVRRDANDGSIRPNQVLAVSLHYSMLPQDLQIRILDVVERDLLTPLGLRTLAPSDPQYSGRYEGSPAARDSVYHQGAVWPWLLGPFITAYVRVHPGPDARKRAAGWLDEIRRHLAEACLGTVSEITDGDAPHTPRGAFAQAWSVAEILRAAVEDVHGLRPGRPAVTVP